MAKNPWSLIPVSAHCVQYCLHSETSRSLEAFVTLAICIKFKTRFIYNLTDHDLILLSKQSLQRVREIESNKLLSGSYKKKFSPTFRTREIFSLFCLPTQYPLELPFKLIIFFPPNNRVGRIYFNHLDARKAENNLKILPKWANNCTNLHLMERKCKFKQITLLRICVGSTE